MVGTAHFFAGAAIARATGRPWLALPLSLVSHFALDAIPHLGPHSLFGVEGQEANATEVRVAVVDVLVGAALLGWVTRRSADRWLLVGSVCAAIVPDALFNVPFWCPVMKTWAGTAWLSVLHDAVDHNLAPRSWLLGLSTQAGVTALGWWFVRRPGNGVRERFQRACETRVHEQD